MAREFDRRELRWLIRSIARAIKNVDREWINDALEKLEVEATKLRKYVAKAVPANPVSTSAINALIANAAVDELERQGLLSPHGASDDQLLAISAKVRKVREEIREELIGCRTADGKEVVTIEDILGQAITVSKMPARISTPPEAPLAAADERERLEDFILQLRDDGIEHGDICARLDAAGFASRWAPMSWQQAFKKHQGKVKTWLSKATKRAVTRRSYLELPGNSVTGN